VFVAAFSLVVFSSAAHANGRSALVGGSAGGPYLFASAMMFGFSILLLLAREAPIRATSKSTRLEVHS
jgi:hypothetical protein